MIVLTRLTLRDRLMEMLFPRLRHIRVDQTEKAIRILIANPEEPCIVDKWLLPDGLGALARRIK